MAERLYPYLGGIIRAEKGQLLAIGGVEDHVHLYLRWRADVAISDLMRIVKSSSSRWMHEEFPALRSCAWQEGYGVFSVSKSQEDIVKKYIAGQQGHIERSTSKPSCLICCEGTASNLMTDMSSNDADAVDANQFDDCYAFRRPSGADALLAIESTGCA